MAHSDAEGSEFEEPWDAYIAVGKPGASTCPESAHQFNTMGCRWCSRQADGPQNSCTPWQSRPGEPWQTVTATVAALKGKRSAARRQWRQRWRRQERQRLRDAGRECDRLRRCCLGVAV